MTQLVHTPKEHRLLKVTSVEKSYGSSESKTLVLRGISLNLARGETLALTGESGSGKSTLLHIACGLEDADDGSVHVQGQNLMTMNDSARALFRLAEIAVVFQQFNLVPSLTVAANITFHAALAGRVDKPHVDGLITALGLSDHVTKYPEALSGGQQQRVAIARALAARPNLILADEPTGNLDEQTAEVVLDQMLKLVAASGAAMMVVTHSPKVAARMDRTLHLSGGRLV